MSDSSLTVSGLPEGTLAITQGDLPAYRVADLICEAAAELRRRRREPRQEPPQVRLDAQPAIELGWLPGSSAEAHALKYPTKCSPH